MPIKVACACGAAFAAKDELAGRTVACPKCKQPLTIPRPQAAAVPAAPAAPHANAGLFDDLGLKARDTNVARCSSCGAEMAPNAIICIKCGFNTKLGRRMETISMGGGGGAAAGGGGHGGHGGDATAMLMARAALNAEEDAIAEASKTTAGAPLWVWIVALFGCLLFGLVMYLVPQHVALFGTAMLLLLLAGLMQLYSWVGVMIKAAQKNPLYAVGIFFGDIILAVGLVFLGLLLTWMMESDIGMSVRILTGAVWLTYAYLHSEECGQFIMIFWLSFAVQIVAWVMAFIAALIFVANKDAGVSWQPPTTPDSVVRLCHDAKQPGLIIRNTMPGFAQFA
jgi:hypothetical protein